MSVVIQSGSSNRTVIGIEDVRVKAYHGVYDSEKKIGNEFSVDIYLWTEDNPAANSDSLKDTVDYAKVYNAVLEEWV